MIIPGIHTIIMESFLLQTIDSIYDVHIVYNIRLQDRWERSSMKF